MDPGKWGFSRQVPGWKSPIGCLEMGSPLMGIEPTIIIWDLADFGCIEMAHAPNCIWCLLMCHEEMMMNHRIWVYHGFFPCFFSQTRHVILCTSNGFPCRLLLTPLLDHHVTQRGFFPAFHTQTSKIGSSKFSPNLPVLRWGKNMLFSPKKSLTSPELNRWTSKTGQIGWSKSRKQWFFVGFFWIWQCVKTWKTL